MSHLIEMHFHTAETSSCGNVLAANGVRELIEYGYKGVIVTDHFRESFFNDLQNLTWEEQIDIWAKGYNTAKKAAEGTNFKVYLGMEIQFTDSPNEYLVYGLTMKFLKLYPNLYKMTPDTFFPIANKNKLFVAQAHPFRRQCSPYDKRFLHGMEIFNGNVRHNSNNDKAVEFCEKNSLIPISGSDYHEYVDLGTGGMYFDKLPETSTELIEILFSRKDNKVYKSFKR